MPWVKDTAAAFLKGHEVALLQVNHLRTRIFIIVRIAYYAIRDIIWG